MLAALKRSVADLRLAAAAGDPRWSYRMASAEGF
jgi:hypothetical protein